MANQIVVSAGAKVRNLSGVLTGTSGVVSSVPLGAANGVATLDSGGKVPVSQLPSSVVTYLGTWNAATNTPTLANGTGDAGDMYICNVAGTVNFGAGPVVFVVGDWVLYGSGTWQKSSGQNGTVTSVAITETGDSLNITGSPITTSGTINIGFNGTNLQYVNGAGNLTTFPILTGYVPYTGATANLNLGIYSFIANDGAYNTEMSPSYFGVENAAGTIFGLLEYNKLTLTNSTGAGSTMIVNAQGLIFPDASVQTSSYTDAKARLALSLTTTGTSGVATYNNATGVFNIPNYGSGLSGYVPYTGATTDVDLGAFKLNAQSLHIKGTGGLGHLGLKHQSASATASANEVSLFADSLGDLGWLNGNLYLSKFIISGNTAARSYTFPDATCNIPNDSLVVHLAGTETITGAKTFSGGVTFTSSLTTNNLTFANSGFFLTLQPPTLSVNRTVTLPNGTGTLALTSDIPSITGLVPYTGATGSVNLGAYLLTASGVDSVGYTARGSGTLSGYLIIKQGTTYLGNVVGYNSINANARKYVFISDVDGTNYKSAIFELSSLTNNTDRTYTLPDASGTIALVGGAGVGTVTSVAALTIGTSGTDLSSSVATSTTTPVITLNVPTASASNRGALSSADWTTFNSKQGTITLTTTGTSGAATFSSNTLNIPNYGSALSGYLPLTGGTLTGALSGTTASFLSTSTNTQLKLGYDASYSYGMGRNSSDGLFYFQVAGAGASGYVFQSALSGTSASFTGTVTNQANNISADGSGVVLQGYVDNTLRIAVRGSGYNSGARGGLLAGTGDFGGALSGTSASFSSTLQSNGVLTIGNQFVSGNYCLNITPSTTTPIALQGILAGTGAANIVMQASGGNVLIGTTTDLGYKLLVAGNLYVKTSSVGTLCNFTDGIAQSFQINTTSSGFDITNPNSGYISFSNTTERMRITSGGVVQIANASGTQGTIVGSERLNVNGDVYAYGKYTGTSFFESSDSRLKTLIQDNYQTKGIASITPKLYTKNGKVELGYYAQDFVGILDSAISKGSDDMLSLSYREVHTAKIYALEQRIKELENK